MLLSKEDKKIRTLLLLSSLDKSRTRSPFLAISCGSVMLKLPAILFIIKVFDRSD